jgi:hypothetical protein
MNRPEYMLSASTSSLTSLSRVNCYATCLPFSVRTTVLGSDHQSRSVRRPTFHRYDQPYTSHAYGNTPFCSCRHSCTPQSALFGLNENLRDTSRLDLIYSTLFSDSDLATRGTGGRLLTPVELCEMICYMTHPAPWHTCSYIQCALIVLRFSRTPTVALIHVPPSLTLTLHYQRHPRPCGVCFCP